MGKLCFNMAYLPGKRRLFQRHTLDDRQEGGADSPWPPGFVSLDLTHKCCFSSGNFPWPVIMTPTTSHTFLLRKLVLLPSILSILEERVEMPELRAIAKQQRQIKRRDGQKTLSKIHPEHHIPENGIICKSCTEHRLQCRLKTFVDKTMESSHRYCLV